MTNHDARREIGASRSMLGSGLRRARRGGACGFAALLVCGALPALMVGCGKEEAPAIVEYEPPPPPPPPAPTVTSIADLMERYGIDPRVRLPENLAPPDDASRIAVLKFFDGFVRGDAVALGDMLSSPDQLELERLEKSGLWEPVIAQITRCDVRTGETRNGRVALAVFHVGRNFQAQLWTYETAPEPEFSAEPTPPNIIDRLSGDDWIASWYAVLEEEMRKANEPDEVVVIRSTVLDENPAESAASSSPNPDLPVRRGGGGGGTGRRPLGEPIDPPSFAPGG
ncbi:MAG TPA: hypothetical protein PKC43_07850 [Phycisphaerales bacterium]|nr:hypothetical protein [Phycisphaerales bacterium]HMP37350.1 hypothetical protein [Phycisphaerales bacterium]